MKLEFLLFLVLKAALQESLAQVYGPLGGNVTLRSGADPTWGFISIHWSIFPNNTWIASDVGGKKNLKRVYRYEDRLDLNSSSGDLTIYNLSEQDAMEYTVDLINNKTQNSKNKIKLIVRLPLQKPTIETYNRRANQGGCRMMLCCSSNDDGVELSWTKPSDVTPFKRFETNETLLLEVSLNPTQDPIDFTCTSRSNGQEASADITAKCDGEDQPPPEPGTPQPKTSTLSRERYAVAVIVSAIISSALTACTLMVIKRRRNPKPINRNGQIQTL